MSWRIGVLLSALAGVAHADLPSLERPGTLTVLVVDDEGHARCEPWRVDPTHHVLIAPAVTRHYSNTADRVELETVTDGDTKHACHVSRPAHEHADALVVDGASWFRDPRGCAAALAHHQAVATDLDDCEIATLPSETQVAASRTKFEHLMGYGGTVYTISKDDRPERCEAVAVHVDRELTTRTELAAQFISVYRDAQQRTETRTPYVMTPGADSLAQFPSTSQTVYQVPPDGGTGSYGCPCVERIPLELDADSFTLVEKAYFTQQRCRAVIAAGVARASWWPLPESRWDW